MRTTSASLIPVQSIASQNQVAATQSPIEKTMSDMDRTIMELSDGLAVLVGKIEPVLSPSEPSQASGISEVGCADLSSHDQALKERIGKLRVILGGIHSITSRVTL